MKGKKILIAITGSIAAYKIPLLLRLFVKHGAEVKVVMTPAAAQFVSPLVLSTLSRHKVHVDLVNDNDWANHVMLGRWADVMLVAPASCNSIAKMAQGICDNLFLSVYLSATCPVIVCPAMDEDMWHHQSLQRNLSILKSYGNEVMNAEHGELASGLVGMGRMAEPETIFAYVEEFFLRKQRFRGKRVLITAGPTYENIDPVRFIGNYSSGKMGLAIAEQFAAEGAEVHLILGPTQLVPGCTNIQLHSVRSAQDMFDACVEKFQTCDIAVMAAAVADYTPTEVATEKIKKKEGEFTITLQKTKDILKHLGSLKSDKQVLVGFALESHNEEAYAKKKLQEKNADAIVLNSLKDSGAGFAHETNKITIFGKDGSQTNYELKSKTEVATDIVDYIFKHFFHV